MTNKQRWDLITRDITSPQSFKDFAFYFLVSSCLQRRVWTGGFNPNDKGQLYPNIYVVLTGPPGVGKGRAMNPVKDLLQYWRIDLASGTIKGPDLTKPNNDDDESAKDPFLFSCGPDDLTYQALLKRQARSIRYVDWSRCRGNTPRPDGLPNKYGSSPMHFTLEELSSLFHKDARQTAKYLLQAYDCNDYEKETVGRGIDFLKKPCLSFLAGTTPGNLEEQMEDNIIDDGLAARIWFIYEMVEGQRRWGFTPADEAQKQAKVELLDYIKSLAFVYGRCHFSSEADAYMKHWWEIESMECRPNNSPKLATYYTRKIIHATKLAMIGLFSEQTADYEIPLSIAQWAVSTLGAAEKRMHYALNFKGRNPLAAIAARVLSFMFEYRKPVTLEYILASDGGGFYSELNEMEAKEVMRHLQGVKQIYVPKGDFYFPTALKGREGISIGSNGNGSETVGSELKALPLDISRGTENI